MIDIPTNEHIISVFFMRDVLLVKCERSSWKIVYTGNEFLPFVFQKINTELGCESTFSIVPFDQGVFAIGNYGITVDDSVNVRRIDEKIPDIVFQFNNDQEGIKRVYGIRDFSNQLVYWTYPNSAQDPEFPNKTLVFNYINKTWAIFNDSFTCFGYFQKAGDTTWATLPYASWADWDVAWNSGITQSQYPDVIAGNQQGYTLLVQQQVANAPSLFVTDIAAGVVTSPSHNLQDGTFLKITGALGTGISTDIVFKITVTGVDTFTGFDADGDPIEGSDYLGGGEITILQNMDISSKVFSPFYDQGAQVKLGYMDFFLDKTSEGEVTLNLYVNENDSLAINDPNSVQNEGLLGDNIILTRPENTTQIPFQQYQKKIWHRIFFNTIVQNFQYQINFDDTQMYDEAINSADFVLHANVLYVSDNVRLIQ